MFILTRIKDVVQLEPRQLGRAYHLLIRDRLEYKYSNRVLMGVGLGIRVFDILNVQEPFVTVGEGSVRVKVEFRLVVFRPFRGEILQARIRSCTEEGVHASLGFFTDILIPPSFLPDPSVFNREEQLWTWQCDGGEIYMDLEEEIRIRVVQETFTESNPNGAKAGQPDGANSEHKSPFALICSMNEPGLGCPSWWAGSD